ncbi:MAG: alpha/beta hydrolase [Clostridia bacterium]|nr:alpha/beta hydrolase [Clostridia bacterium]
MSVKIISTDNYAETMKNTVEPYIFERGHDGYFKSFKGGDIHFYSFKADEPKGGIVISHGFTESAEKFFEMMYYFLKAGLNVFALDHRGHGKSLRQGNNPEYVYLDSFDDYIRDFKDFVENTAVPENGGLPLYLYAHSMGGAVAAIYLEKYQCLHFTKAVLTAPMIYANTANLPHVITGSICGILNALGQGKGKVPGSGGFDASRTWETSNATSKERFDYWHNKRIENVCYQHSTPTNKWVLESVKISPFILNDENCKKINIPVLLCQAEEDGSVVPSKHNVFIDKLSDGKLIKFEGSRHEIYLSPDNVLQYYLDTILSFLGV